MKETKVYVDELPESCIDCPCCSCDLKPEFIKIGHFMYCNLLKQSFRFKEERKKLKDCPLKSLQDHDKEYEDKIKELQEVDNKRAFRLYSVLYEQLEKEDCENVASRIDYLTGKDYSDICELYKTAKNLKQHDQELDQQKEMWNELKEYISNQIIHYDALSDKFEEENNNGCVLLANSKRSMIEEILYKMQELEKGEKEWKVFI